MALEHGTNGPIATSGTSPISLSLSLSLSVGRDCPQPSHEDAPKNPNNTAMQVNCSHSWNALAIYMCVSLQNLSARNVWIHLSININQIRSIYPYQIIWISGFSASPTWSTLIPPSSKGFRIAKLRCFRAQGPRHKSPPGGQRSIPNASIGHQTGVSAEYDRGIFWGWNLWSFIIHRYP